MTAAASARFEPLTDAFRRDPYAAYRVLRADEPMCWASLPAAGFRGFWFLSRYADVVSVLTDNRFGRELRRVFPPEAFPPIPPAEQPLVEMMERWMVLRDPPQHTRIRRIVSRVFNSRVIADAKPHLNEIAHALIDQFEAQGRTDLVSAFAFPFPVIVVSRLIGVPAADAERFKVWSQGLIDAVDMMRTAEDAARGGVVARELTEYFRDLARRRRSGPREDVLSLLLHESDETGSLTENEVVATCVFLLFAGHETSANMIANGTLALLRQPHELARVASDATLLRTAVDELLRIESPQQVVFRHAMEDVTVAGRLVRKGQAVACGIGAANHDPEEFANPDLVDVGRAHNRHLAFSSGIHHCIGAALARMEGEAAFGALLARLPRLTLSSDDVQWGASVLFRRLKALPVEW